MTLQERENRFIEKCKKDFGKMSFESEQLLRYGFAEGAREMNDVAFIEGTRAQKSLVLRALGAKPGFKEDLA